MTTPVGTVMRRGAELAASRLGRESANRKARRGTVRPNTPPGRQSLHQLPAPRTCAYCSGRRNGNGLTCHAHSDLPAIDPFFSPDVPQRAEPIEDFRPEALLDRLQTIGA